MQLFGVWSQLHLIVQIALFFDNLNLGISVHLCVYKNDTRESQLTAYFNKENLTKDSIFLYNVKSKQQRSKMHFGRKCRKVNVTPVSSVYITRYNFYVTFINEVVGQYCKSIKDLLRVSTIFVTMCLKIIDYYQSYLQINIKSCIQ